MVLPQLKQFWGQLSSKPIAIACVLIFLGCLAVYLINGKTFSSNDNIPHTLLAFNWLENHTFNFDQFRENYFRLGDCLICNNGLPYFFVEAPNGHLTSAYPIGSAIVTFPLYVIFFLYVKGTALIQAGLTGATVPLLDITTRSFDNYRANFDKLAGAIVTALSVVLFYLSLRLKFSSNVALISALLYAFATSAWTLNSQGLRQHTVGNLLLLSIVLCLFKANRVQGTRKHILLVVCGILCGLLPGVRLPSALFTIAVVMYAIVTYRKAAVFLMLGLPSALLSIGWNLYYFGNLTGGYSALLGKVGGYVLKPDYFITAGLGLLISPSSGFFVFSPIAIFAIPGLYLIWKYRSGNDEKLLLCLMLASFGVFINYSLFSPWTGGSASYGSRYMTDLLPIFGFAIAYFLSDQFDRFSQFNAKPQKHYSAALIAFALCAVLSTSIQVLGVSDRAGWGDWGTTPLPISMDMSRIWSLRDSRIERQVHSIYFKIARPLKNRKGYLRNLDGVIEQISNANHQPLSAVKAVAETTRALRATVKNTGRSPWYGYETGMGRGEAQVRVRFLDAENQEIKTLGFNRLYVSGIAQADETASAIGPITFPSQPGTYTMVFDLIVEKLGDFPHYSDQPLVSLPAQVTARKNS